VNLRAAARDGLLATGVLPSRFTWRNPFKIAEYQALLGGVTIRPTEAVLDFGCGGGLQDHLLARRAGRVVGLDVDPVQIERARARAAVYARGRALEFRCAPVEAAGFSRAEFDTIVSFSVIEHVADRETVLATFADVIKPGGRLILSTDSLATIRDPRLIARHRADHCVRDYFTPPQLRTMLEAHGFGDVRVWPIFRSPYAARLFAHGIEYGFRASAPRRFGVVARLAFEDRRHRDAAEGIFLCAHGVRRP
jgi:SAM-dependent methyltransferase